MYSVEEGVQHGLDKVGYQSLRDGQQEVIDAYLTDAGQSISHTLVIKESLKPNVYSARKSGFLISTRWSKKLSGNHPPPEPLKMTQLPSAPWKEVAMDFLGPFPNGEYLLVVIDAFSRFPEVEVLTTVSAKAVLPKLDAIFSRQGLPEVLKSDNGPPFNGAEFESYAKHCGFTHRKITPYWPQANGEAERFMRTPQKCIRVAIID
ncbi:Transposon Ty3-G Gag-Pol poly [Paramuricea clavata]|uniref:Transposon Ty3-G Gag-Pol poly n=1 Tax=Paramuricea clavata TaxID=317549 RepID=A0A6S7JRT2_PARCT|nr:Transposon Ty3-G Gag-Pol poly [Paramuricea clavata]